jgi:hypothetical protein
MTIPVAALAPRERILLFLGRPDLWPHWPFLPVTRHKQDGVTLGVLFDALHAANLTGYSATIFLTNLLLIPDDLGTLLALPREVFDTPEEVYVAGWRID